MVSSLPRLKSLQDRIMYALERARLRQPRPSNVYIAEVCGLSKAVITQWENRVIADPTKFSAQACFGLATLSGLPPDWIALGEADPNLAPLAQKLPHPREVTQFIRSMDSAPKQTKVLLGLMRKAVEEKKPVVAKPEKKRLARSG